ncbi:hypothetical protein ACFL6C_14565 [Myxococcota bacterium]
MMMMEEQWRTKLVGQLLTEGKLRDLEWLRAHIRSLHQEEDLLQLGLELLKLAHVMDVELHDQRKAAQLLDIAATVTPNLAKVRVAAGRAASPPADDPVRSLQLELEGPSSTRSGFRLRGRAKE